MSEEAKTPEDAATEKPVVLHATIDEVRKPAKLDYTLAKSLRERFDELIQDLTPKFIEKDLKAAEAKADKQRTAFQKEVEKGQAKATEEELSALAKNKTATVNTLTYVGLGIGVFIGAMVIASPPAIIAAAITGLAELFGASAVGVAGTAAAVAITSNVTMGVGLLTSAVMGVAGYFGGQITGKNIASNMKPDIGNRDFSVTAEQKKEITESASQKAAVRAAELLVQELWEDKLSLAPKYKSDAMETSLTAMVRKLKLENADTQTLQPSYRVIEEYRDSLTTELDRAHEIKLAKDREKAHEISLKEAAADAKAEKDRSVAREERAFNLQEIAQLAQLQVGMRKAGIGDDNPIMQLLTQAGGGEGGLDAMQMLLLQQMLQSNRGRGGDKTPITPTTVASKTE